MTNKNISSLTAATIPLAGTELVPVWNGSATVKALISSFTVASLPGAFSTLAATSAITARGTEATVGGSLGAWATSSMKVTNRSGINDLSSINFGYNAGTYASAYITLIITNNAGNSYGDIVFGTRAVATDTQPTTRLTVKADGDVQFNTGNLVQGTAARGVNFTANTPAAGMTSQLLNWYEEGTWGGVSASANLSSIVLSSMRYTRIGRQITLTAYITATVTASATLTYIVLQTLPFALGNYLEVAGSCTSTVANATGAVIGNNANSLYMFLKANSGIVAGSDGFSMTVTYFI